MRRLGAWVATAGVVVVLSTVTTLAAGAIAVVGGALLLANLFGLWSVAAGRRRATTGPSSALASCWLAAALFPVHNFSRRANSEAVSSLGLQPLVELLLFGAIGAFALHVLRRVEPTLRTARPPLAVLALPVWVGLSALWSDTAAYAANDACMSPHVGNTAVNASPETDQPPRGTRFASWVRSM